MADFLPLISGVLLVTSVQSVISRRAVVETTYGPVEGKIVTINSTQTLDIYLGVPYAKPPTGANRWSRPYPPDKWTEARDATRHGAKCTQRIIYQDPPLENVPFGEDCLFVDIYTMYNPSIVTNRNYWPTMMFIHGGGYYGGSGALYNFTNVALRGVTVVSVSYRLDIFGFLSTLDDVIPGNFGLMDQALALDWVRSNIAKFGGDPDNIVIFGGSSGAISTSLFLLSPLTQGKFHKAIMQSGAASCNWSHHSDVKSLFDYPLTTARLIGQRLNCSLPTQEFSSQLLDCLRKLPAETIINASVHLQENTFNGSAIFYPVIENTFGFIPYSPSKLLERMDPKYYVPTIYGYTREDGSYFVFDPYNDGITVEEFKAEIQLYAGDMYHPRDQNAVISRALDHYLPSNTTGVSNIELRSRLVQAMTDLFYVGCSVHEAKRFAAKTRNPKTYIYEFAHRPNYSVSMDWMGVAHADEKGFVLGLPQGPDSFRYPLHDDDDIYVADFVVTAWTNFAKYGDPSPAGSGLTPWPAIDPRSRDLRVMEIKREERVKKFDRQTALDVWIIDNSIPDLLNTGRNRNSDTLVIFSLLACSTCCYIFRT